MNLIVLERQFEPPITIADLVAGRTEGAWCMELHRVEHRTSLLSLDGRDCICVFRAPDAEAVRSTMRQLQSPLGSAWPASVHAPSAGDSGAVLEGGEPPLVLVERTFDVPVSVAELQKREDLGAWCLEQHRVQFLRTYSSLDSKRMLCLYRAPDAESVRLAQREAGMPFACVRPVVAWEPAP